MRKYSNKKCEKFVEDMEAVGLTVFHYRGRFFWEGPAVDVGNLQDALSNTKIKCQWDNMGLGWVAYPVESDAGVEVEEEEVKAGLDPLKSKKNKRRGEMTNKPTQYRVETGSVFEFYPEDNGPGAYWFIGKLNGKTLKQFIAAIARRACYGEAEDQQMYLR